MLPLLQALPLLTLQPQMPDRPAETQGKPMNMSMLLKCPFCDHLECRDVEILFENEYFAAILDQYPVSIGHMLLIPRRHIDNPFQLSEQEVLALNRLLQQCKAWLDEHYHPSGFNVGINCGAAAGQTVMHLHVHLIPRYDGDVPDPRGGVRSVIPRRKLYPLPPENSRQDD